ncbi:hypothetical protein [Glaciimonas immobilis]|uniref:YD repeat-containing protein n=1 Tax=Glaciimonas immobilis TaxID=728004 RepID=A0A840RZ48_9BURK|nr:hypothetical protein [Glaciimonas immobilis]KAF3998307.1 hypothetical protein HAV38_08865 [Glaciimonas immobilis]MBB5201924.1 YD repeat-containing protein [Glaciimonas immobilis]
MASSGTAQARTTTTEWHPVFRQPIRIAEPHRIITLTYDDFGNVITKAYQATTDAAGAQNFSGATVGKAQTWAYTYNTLGQRSAVTGPRAEVPRYACDDAGNLT